ncbi:MAG: hypothetical protein BGO83_18635 [Devosia sp. 66-14]|nr:MAG: hypothetical protein ABS47_10520 [Devosia sp. SCN 66-27]OJX22794.1 MAG: hypothetical protein BGO83_18635 [Devosia sp. 66-14]
MHPTSALSLCASSDSNKSLRLSDYNAYIGFAQGLPDRNQPQEQSLFSRNLGRVGRHQKIVGRTAEDVADSYQRLERWFRTIKNIVRIRSFRNSGPTSNLGVCQPERSSTAPEIVCEHLHRKKMFLTKYQRHVICRQLIVAVLATNSGAEL